MPLAETYFAGTEGMKKTAAIIVLLLLAAAPFLPGLKAGFTNWDDNVLVTENQNIRQLDLTKIGKIFTHSITGAYIPLVELSFALEYAVSGLNPVTYHLDNIILHVINTFLVFALILLLTGNRGTGFFAALLWAVHPMKVESVAWVTERKDLLYGLFSLLSFNLYLIWRKEYGGKFYLFSVLAFVLSALSKGAAVTMPLLLLLADWRENGRVTKINLLNKLPYAAVAILVTIAWLLAQRPEIPYVHDGRMPLLLENFFIACHNILFYISKTVWPARLSILYPYPQLQHGWLPLAYLAAPLVVMALAGLIFYSRRWTKEVIFWSLFFLVSVLPMLQLKRIMGDAMAADRHIYIPSIGLLCLLVLGLQYLGRRFSWKAFAPGIAAVICLPLMLLSWQRSGIWHDEISLWTSLSRQEPAMERPYMHLSIAYGERGDYAMAVNNCKRLSALNPRSAYNNSIVAYVYGLFGQNDSVIAYYNQAISIDPKDPEYYKNRGIAYVLTGRSQEAASDFTMAIRLSPDYAEAFNGRAVVYYNMGKYEWAYSDIIRARELGFAVDLGLYAQIARAAKRPE
jgi:tetratricopeptide (TPR) repeat protein